MANTDTPKTSGKPIDGSSAESATRTSAEATPSNVARVDAQTGDPYRPKDSNDYTLSINPDDTGEATVANLFQAVPLEYEGTGGALHDGEGLAGDGVLDGDGRGGAQRNGLGLDQTDNVPLPEGELDVVETFDGGIGDAGGIGGGDAPEARGLDAGLSQFDLGGNGIPSGDPTIGDGIGGGGGGAGPTDGLEALGDDDDGDDGGPGVDGDDDDGDDDGDDGSPIGPLSDVNPSDNLVEENAVEGTPVGVVAFADDPDLGDDVTYEIIGNSPFVIDPVTGVISVGPGAVIDREEFSSIDVTVRATSSDGSSVEETFTIQIGDDNTEFEIGPVTDVDTDANFVMENATGGTGIDVTAFAEDLDATDTVTYEIIGDSPFVIDPVTGILTVANGAEIDREETPFIDVTVRATSTDGSTSQATFRVEVGDENEFEIGPVIDTDTTDNFVEENSDGGTVVGITAFAEDPDATDTVTYEIVGDSPFVIDPVTGVITVAPGADIDFEATPFIDVTVQATSTDGSTSQETFRVTVGDDNEFEIGPVIDTDDANNFVEENSDGGTVVGITAFAEDPDSSDTVTYEIIGDSPFVIDPATGVITVAPGADIDRETTPFIDVTVRATSTDGSTSQETFRVTVGDENEFEIGPVTDTDADRNFVLENSDEGTVVGVTAFAEDPDATDTVTYEIVGDSPFVIDPVTGVITVGPGADIDRETTPFIDVTVKATSTDGSTSQETFRVTVGDDNESDIGPVIDIDTSNNDLNAVAENGTGGEEVGITAFAEDPDDTDTVTYSTDDPRFDIDPDTGVLTVKPGVSFDYEQTQSVDVDITATSSDGSSSTGTFSVNILDVNEAPDLVFETGDVATVVEEVQGAQVTPLSVADPDFGDTHTFTISDDRFEVVVSGNKYVLKLKDDQALDYETETQVSVTVTATDSGGLSDTETIIIDVIDVDENTAPIGPLSDADVSSNLVAENSDSGTVVGVTAFAEDPDDIDTVTYEIVDQDSPFVIDPNTGVISVAPGAEIDREATPSIDVTVKATSTDGSTTTKTFTVQVGDENEFEIGPVMDVDVSDNTISETADGGEDTGITAFAEDEDATDTVTYELTGGDDRFEIDENTGVITVKDGAQFDADTEPAVDVTVTATSTDGSSSSNTFTIDVTDGNEPPDLIVHLDNAANELVINGGFENFTGTLKGSDGTGWYDIPDTLEGWTYADVDIHQSARHGEGTTDGDHRLDLTADDNGVISQVIEGQLDGQVYTLSFNMNSRGNTPGEGVAEVYWNGELIDTIDPTDGGGGWQSYSYDIVGGSGDGSNTLRFVEIGSDNSHGTYIDSVSIRSDGRIAVLEEYMGAEIAPLSVIDPDVGDTHTFTVSDDRFEVVASDGKYLLKLKDDQALDYETETQVTVQVTVTDSGGLSDTETVIVDVIDIDEDSAPIGPLSDADPSSNMVAENADGGTFVGVIAFATDPDNSDTVTYEIVDQDSPFVIDPISGVISVAPGAEIDREAKPSIDVTVKATSTDGSTTTKTFTVQVGDENEFEIGPVTDVDVSDNTISETADGGEDTGITAFAEDEDATDTVTYELTGGDDRFEIDENTGVITVKDGAQFDADTESAVDVTVTATSTDGSSSSNTFTIDITDGNEPPDLVVEYGGVGTNLIMNGSFESFDVANGTWKQFSQDDSGAWSSNGKMEIWDDFGGVSATEGDQHLELDSETNVNSISQTVETSAGQIYDLSFDVQARTNDTSNTVEVYWNGELISSVDPDHGNWQTVDFQVVGTGGNDVLEFRETSEDNNTYGAFIDNVQLTGTDRIGVLEELEGAAVVPLSVIDPDVGDTHTFTLSDDRFEVVAADGKYLLKLKDDQALDYETEQQVTVQITATDSGGLSDTETVVIDVINIDEGSGPVGPLTDADDSANAVSETAAAGDTAGITAYAVDNDAADTVTYELTSTDDRFEIDENTGVITVADGAQFDANGEPTIDLTVQATSTDGSTSSKTFTVEVTDGNEAPDLIVHLENGSQQFVVNGSFEVFDGTLGGRDGSGWYQNPDSIEGWAYNDVDVHQAGHVNFGATDGGHHLDLAALTNGWASQEIEGQLEGQVYELSFDMKSRGGVGQSVAEVYWNGELIDTIDPATTGSGWQTFNFNIIGGSGDGSNTLTFVEIGSDNNGGALIDSVSIVSDNRTAVVEEFAGAEIAPLSVIDPDVGDTHTFTVSDDRFEVVVSGDKYMLKLKDDQALDYETETQVTLEITATDQGGLSDTEIVVIDVIDIDEANAPIGDLVDTDTADNTVAVNASGGTLIGLTAFANDPDADDTVTYSITDPRFEIDPDSGVVTVADNADFDPDQTPVIDLEVTATSTDGSSVTETFRIDVAEMDTAPDLDFDPELGPGVSVTMTFVSEVAGYSNVLGVFTMDGSGDPVGGEIVWVDQNQLTPGESATVYLEGVDAGDVGYFLIPDGADTNSGLASGDQVTFAKDSNGDWQAFSQGGVPLVGENANVYFSGNASLNPDGYDHTTEMGVTVNFEDQVNGGDQDHDDLVFDQTIFEIDATAGVYEDQPGAVAGELTVVDPDVGDTHTFTVSDDRFEVVEQNGTYVLKLKDGEALDYETETEVTVSVTATDSGGLSDTETIVIDVIDVEPEDGNASVGPVRDADTAQNLVAATAAAGAIVGLTAFAQDADTGDTVTYSIDDNRFDIDENTGVVTVADGVTLTAGETINVTVTAISSDGTQSSAEFPIEVTEGGDNTAPDLIEGDAVYSAGKPGGRDDDDDDDDRGHHRDDDDDDDDDHDDDDGGVRMHISTNDVLVPENEAGAGVVELTVVDPDVGDTHTFAVSDDRFEVVSDGDAYLLKLKDGVALDYENEQSINVDVTVTDSGGLSDTESITLDVVDVDDDSSVSEYGTNQDDVMVGSDEDDALYARGGDDTVIGQDGDDFLSGGSGDDVIRGGEGNDTTLGDDGSDVFAYMLGDGNDSIYGGAGENWIDIVDLGDASDGTPLGSYGADWSVTTTEGSIENVDTLNGEIALSQDAGGHIDLADGAQVDFSEIEGIQY